jgi:hypothetical protein
MAYETVITTTVTCITEQTYTYSLTVNYSRGTIDKRKYKFAQSRWITKHNVRILTTDNNQDSHSYPNEGPTLFSAVAFQHS